jgi:hypothetical protein
LDRGRDRLDPAWFGSIAAWYPRSFWARFVPNLFPFSALDSEMSQVR